jgi:signal transduction histidine kinase
VRYRTDAGVATALYLLVLHEFLSTHRPDLIDRCRQSAAERNSVQATEGDSRFGIPLFLDQLITTLKAEQASGSSAGEKISGAEGGGSRSSEVGAAAAQHGRELSQRGLTVDQVVHDYGDLCQAITGLAFELGAPITTLEFKTLNRCLDNGIADAVTEFSYQRDRISGDRESQALNQRIGFLAHDLRDHISTATYAIRLMKSGKVALSGATGAVLDRALIGMRSVIDRSLADVRMSVGVSVPAQTISIADLVAEVQATASLEAESRGCQFSVSEVDPSLAVNADRDLLLSAVGNLLNNAFKFTQPGTAVSLKAIDAGNYIRLEVQDHCGGLPPGNPEDLFQPFEQRGEDKSGVGLGLAICRRSVEANHGTLSVRDLPRSGCVFSIQLPRSRAVDAADLSGPRGVVPRSSVLERPV